jgi:hypothetical protein
MADKLNATKQKSMAKNAHKPSPSDTPIRANGTDLKKRLETTEIKPAPGRKTSENPTWVRVKDGIWRNTTYKKVGRGFESPPGHHSIKDLRIQTEFDRTAKSG